MINKEILKNLNFRDPAVWLATWGGCGLMRPAPGTWGTLGALPFGILLLVFTGPVGLAIAAALITAVGFWASKKVEDATGEHDLSLIVIDEAAGIWIALITAPLTPLAIVLTFVLFRILDALKPWPIGMIDKRLSGPAGVMLDDIVAGIITAALIYGVHYAGYI